MCSGSPFALHYARYARRSRPYGRIGKWTYSQSYTVGRDLIQPITLALNRGKLPISFSLAVSCQQRPIFFSLPFEFYL